MRRSAMGILDKAKAAALEATTKAKEGVEDVQLKRELGQSYGELGKATFALVESGAITNTELDAVVEKIRTLIARLEADTSDPAAPDTEAAASE
jgi:hypothetical protein